MSEIKLFEEVQLLLGDDDGDEQGQRESATSFSKGFTSQKHLSYKQNKLHQMLNVKITVEEEKYVYLFKNLKEYPSFVSKIE